MPGRSQVSWAVLVLAMLVLVGAGLFLAVTRLASPDVTKVQFLTQADLVCDRVTQDFKVANERVLASGASYEQQRQELYDAALMGLESQRRDMGRLPVPDDQRAAVDAYLAAFDEGLQRARALGPANYGAGGPDPLEPALHLGRSLGLSRCG